MTPRILSHVAVTECHCYSTTVTLAESCVDTTTDSLLLKSYKFQEWCLYAPSIAINLIHQDCHLFPSHLTHTNVFPTGSHQTSPTRTPFRNENNKSYPHERLPETKISNPIHTNAFAKRWHQTQSTRTPLRIDLGLRFLLNTNQHSTPSAIESIPSQLLSLAKSPTQLAFVFSTAANTVVRRKSYSG